MSVNPRVELGLSQERPKSATGVVSNDALFLDIAWKMFAVYGRGGRWPGLKVGVAGQASALDRTWRN